jgi:hypothetical protein
MTDISDKIDIVQLIEKNPITRFTSDTYSNKLVNKIKNTFTDTQQQLFLGSFYCYLNCNKTYNVDLDNVWKWCGFSRKDHAKILFEKHFIKDVDYIILLPNVENPAPTTSGVLPKVGWKGENKEQILMTVKTFKKFCLKARTKKADEIHEYYIKLEELLQETIEEESEELRNQLLLKDEELKICVSEMEENILINSSNKKLVYVGIVEENLVKFGYSKGIERRVLYQHKKEFNSFILKYTIHSDDYIELEDNIKEKFKDRRKTKIINDKNQTELIQLDADFTIENLYRDILQLDKDIKERKRVGTDQVVIKLNTEITKLRYENEKLKKLLHTHNIETNITTNVRKNKTNLLLDKYFLEYLVFLYEKNKDTEIHCEPRDLYDEYKKIMLEELKYSSNYVMEYTKFNFEIIKNPSVKRNRKTLEKTDKRYIPGKDNRVKCKFIKFNKDYINYTKM